MKFLMASKGVWVVIVLSVCFIVLVSKYAPTPRLTYDSRDYLGASQSIATYFHGRNADGFSYLVRPPVIPIYFHFFQDKILAAKWLNVTCFVLSLWFCYLIGKQFKFETIFMVSFLICVASSYSWLQNHFFVWSEPLFGTLLFVLAWSMIRGISWVWISIFCILLYFTRKAGLFVCVGVILEQLFQGERQKAIRMGLVLGAVVISWEIITYVFSGESISQQLFLEHASQSRWYWLDVITAWFIPRGFSLALRAVALLAFAAVLLIHRQKLKEMGGHDGFKTVMHFFSTYLIIFIVFIGVSEFGEADRFLSVMVPFALLLIIAVVRVLSSKEEGRQYWLLLFFVWMIYPIGRTLYHLLG